MMNFRAPAKRWAVTFNIGLDNNPIRELPLHQSAKLVANVIKTSQYEGFNLDRLHNVLVNRGQVGPNAELTLVVAYDQFTTKGLDGVKYFVDRLAYKLAQLFGQEAVAYQLVDTAETSQTKLNGMAGLNPEKWLPFDETQFIPNTGFNPTAAKFYPQERQAA